MKLTFCGASRQVTGSMYLLDLEDDYKILIDCGIEVDRNKIAENEGKPLFAFDPTDVDLVLLTHAHIDHSGNLPNLVKNGYEGQILCTPPTFALTKLLLLDSAALQAKRINAIRNKSKRIIFTKNPEKEPDHYYLESDVDDTTGRFITLAFNREFEVKKGLTVTFLPAGHLLGAAQILITVQEGTQTKTILFSGDLGRAGYPMLVDPLLPKQVDYMICESTYADKTMELGGDYEQILLDQITSTCVEKGGRIVIPAFSIGKTQTIAYLIKKLYQSNKIPGIRFFIDSPLGINACVIYNKFVPFLNKEAKDLVAEDDFLFEYDFMTPVRESRQSLEISDFSGPCIILSSAGMLEGGRIVKHIKDNLESSRSKILFVGYCAEGTLGHRLLNATNEIQIDNRVFNIKAEVEKLDIFSGHAWQEDLFEYIHTQDTKKLKRLFLVHGEVTNMLNFAKVLEGEGYTVSVPDKADEFEL